MRLKDKVTIITGGGVGKGVRPPGCSPPRAPEWWSRSG